ncbi:hypothetical protein [Turicibacter sanguinis]|uniref:hypothetical protein n=1 Tax=Turicibacter sanguinis TaxID=154288 RepID=UPI0018A9870A|nr:hypothetical protein [Turicibacter sanguinis]
MEKQSKIAYWENEIEVLESNRRKYQHKIDFYTSKLKEANSEIEECRKKIELIKEV